jgi:non-specific serine/threonine protein kinase
METLSSYLPASVSQFIGRERELSDVRQQLLASRLVTLTGAGGCGKTRLALEAVRSPDLSRNYAQGIWFIELAALTDPALLPRTVAQALGLTERVGEAALTTLTQHLSSQTTLLVLDNCEHLVGACASLAASLLQACPQLSILATSREGLNVAGERMYRVPSLQTPTPVQATQLPLTDLAQYEAVQLFVSRATAAQPHFRLTTQNVAIIAQICRRLDGIPLALELAAARVRALSVAQLAERLADSFQVLTCGSRTALRRHQTLRALVDWSYDLLSVPESALLRQLSVFAGGWMLDMM